MDYTPTRLRLRLYATLVMLASCSATRGGPQDGSDGHALDEVYAHARRHGIEAGAEAMRERSAAPRHLWVCPPARAGADPTERDARLDSSL